MNEIRLYAVAGNPVLHSKSPDMFNVVFRAKSMDAHYLCLALSGVEEMRRIMEEVDILGLNVTSPFKETIIPFLDEMDDTARRVGAVNTVVRDHGRLTGYNTDVQGVRKALLSDGMVLKGSKALVLGAGGAAKAAICALLSEGARVFVANRTEDKARHLAAALGCTWTPLTEIGHIAKDLNVIVSCLSTDEEVFPADALRKEMVILDAFYGKETHLVRSGYEKGCIVIDGREWLLFQGAAAFLHFTNSEPSLKTMRGALLRPVMAQRKGIVLTGFMGTGKSTVGTHLAGLSGLPFIDIDREIEKKHASPIAEIFRKQGEKTFRAMETAEIEKTVGMPPSVISCGGGAVLNKGNVEILRRNHVVVWLWANTQIILDRVGKDGTRPLLNVENKRSAIETMLQERKPYYAMASHILVDTTNKSPEEVAERIFYESRNFIIR